MRLLAAANRLMPLAFLGMALVVIAQFWLQHGPSGIAMGGYLTDSATFLRAHAWGILGLAGGFWFLTFAGYFHERQRRRTRISIKEAD